MKSHGKSKAVLSAIIFEVNLLQSSRFGERINKEYNHLGIAFDKNSNRRYIETFFHQDTDMYIKGQTIVKVKSFALYSPNNHVIVIDSF